jgi:hypothetical protein
MNLPKLKRTVRRLAMGMVPVIVLLVTWPAIPARALGLTDIFGALFSTVSDNLGVSTSAIQGVASDVQNFKQNTLYPLNSLTQYRSFISTVKGTYRPWMSNVYSQGISSTRLSAPTSLDSLLRTSNGTGTSTFVPNYQATYGTPIPEGGSSPLVRQATDMNDAQAIDALSLATSTDQGAANLMVLAQQLEDQSGTTAPGTAEMVSASAMALQLQSLATQHKLLASELRQEASALALANTQVKANANSSVNNSNVVPNLFKVVK